MYICTLHTQECCDTCFYSFGFYQFVHLSCQVGPECVRNGMEFGVKRLVQFGTEIGL